MTSVSEATAPHRPQSTDVAAGGIDPSRLVLLLATILTGLSAGFFFTYEASVTVALADVGDMTYVETFQAINETIRNPAFGVVFFGSIPAIALAIAVNWRSAGPMARASLAAALPLYLIGLAITGTGNVPLNERLAGVDATSAAAATEARADFEEEWNQFDLLRSVAIGGSFSALATAGLVVHPARKADEPSTRGQTA